RLAWQTNWSGQARCSGRKEDKLNEKKVLPMRPFETASESSLRIEIKRFMMLPDRSTQPPDVTKSEPHRTL
ncbi:MAG: hypothetical protein OXD30_09725, partial [Bryobacterales bacterium]|nr:hypothetical protein [Bryobacterales bacterium]